MTGLFLFPTSGAEWRTWLSNEGAAIGTIVVVLVIAWIVVRVVALRLLRRVVRRAAEARHQDPDLAERRTETLVSALNWGIGVILVFVGAVIILGKLGLNVSALIASAGIAGSVLLPLMPWQRSQRSVHSVRLSGLRTFGAWGCCEA